MKVVLDIKGNWLYTFKNDSGICDNWFEHTGVYCSLKYVLKNDFKKSFMLAILDSIIFKKSFENVNRKM